MTDDITVTQEDRDAAASGYFAWVGSNRVIPAKMRAGKVDDHSMVQAFARRAQEAVAAAISSQHASGDVGELVERLIDKAWRWGHGCSTDDIPDRLTKGDSYNESGRDDTAKIAQAIVRRATDIASSLATMTTSRDRTRAALEAMRAERDQLQVRVERMERALRPFAVLSHYYPNHYDNSAIDGTMRPRVGDLRQARSALCTPTEGKTDG